MELSTAQFRIALDRSCRLLPMTVAVALALSCSARSPAATIAVRTGNLTQGVGNCTLLEAANSINQGSLVAATGCNSSGTFGVNDTIELQNFVFSFSNQPSGGNISGDAALVLTKPVTLAGAVDAQGRPLATIQRSQSATDFRLIQTNSSLTLIGVTVQNGVASLASGGGLYGTGTDPIHLSHSTFRNNAADNSGAGIMTSQAPLLIEHSTISGNTAGESGGGIQSYGNSVTINNSTISGNTASAGWGGGIHAVNAEIDLTNSTLQGNYALQGGGGIYAGSVVLDFCTLSGNSTEFGHPGGGALVGANSVATASLMFGNEPGNDIDATVSGLTLGGSHNLIGSHGGNMAVPVDSTSCDPGLATLVNNGGATSTMALPSGSCAINAGPASAPQAITYDQRGNAYPRRIGPATDIGAFEVQPTDRIFIDGFDG